MSMKLSPREMECLSASPFFIPELFDIQINDFVQKYCSEFSKTVYKKNQYIFQEGDIVNHLVYIDQGFAWDTQIGKNGLEKNIIYFPHYLLGINSIAHRQKILYSVKALTNLTCYLIPFEHLITMMQTDRELTKSILKMTNVAARAVANINNQHLSCSAEQKVCQVLYCHYLCETYYPELKNFYFSQQKIAGLAGVHRVSANTIIKNLKEEHILKNIDGQHQIADITRLEELAYEICP